MKICITHDTKCVITRLVRVNEEEMKENRITKSVLEICERFVEGLWKICKRFVKGFVRILEREKKVQFKKKIGAMLSRFGEFELWKFVNIFLWGLWNC